MGTFHCTSRSDRRRQPLHPSPADPFLCAPSPVLHRPRAQKPSCLQSGKALPGERKRFRFLCLERGTGHTEDWMKLETHTRLEVSSESELFFFFNGNKHETCLEQQEETFKFITHLDTLPDPTL